MEEILHQLAHSSSHQIPFFAVFHGYQKKLPTSAGLLPSTMSS
jgi:hypothetical protein